MKRINSGSAAKEMGSVGQGRGIPPIGFCPVGLAIAASAYLLLALTGAAIAHFYEKPLYYGCFVGHSVLAVVIAANLRKRWFRGYIRSLKRQTRKERKEAKKPKSDSR